MWMGACSALRSAPLSCWRWGRAGCPGTTLPGHWPCISCLIIVGDQAYHCLVISKLNDGVGVVRGHTVVGKQGVQEGTKHATPRGPPCWGSTWQKEVFSSRVLSIVMSLEGTMVLNTEL
jgi:hypothetical protein